MADYLQQNFALFVGDLGERARQPSLRRRRGRLVLAELTAIHLQEGAAGERPRQVASGKPSLSLGRVE